LPDRRDARLSDCDRYPQRRARIIWVSKTSDTGDFTWPTFHRTTPTRPNTHRRTETSIMITAIAQMGGGSFHNTVKVAPGTSRAARSASSSARQTIAQRPLAMSSSATPSCRRWSAEFNRDCGSQVRDQLSAVQRQQCYESTTCGNWPWDCVLPILRTRFVSPKTTQKQFGQVSMRGTNNSPFAKAG
jgi:hypothetical protein